MFERKFMVEGFQIGFMERYLFFVVVDDIGGFYYICELGKIMIYVTYNSNIMMITRNYVIENN